MIFEPKWTPEELKEIEAFEFESLSRLDLVHQAQQVITMDSQIIQLQMQGLKDRKRIRDLEEQLDSSHKHGAMMSFRQVMLVASSDPEKLKKNFAHLAEEKEGESA